MYFEGVIDTFEKLMDEIAWDWPDGMWPKDKPKIDKYKLKSKTEEGFGYGINKTAIFKEDGKYWLEYKQCQYEVTPEVYVKFEYFYALLYGK